MYRCTRVSSLTISSGYGGETQTNIHTDPKSGRQRMKERGRGQACGRAARCFEFPGAQSTSQPASYPRTRTHKRTNERTDGRVTASYRHITGTCSTFVNRGILRRCRHVDTLQALLFFVLCWYSVDCDEGLRAGKT